MRIDIWCRVFQENADNRKELLDCIRPLIALSSNEDQTVFNYWADKNGIEKLREE